MNPFAIAIQGLGYGPAQVAVQGLLASVVQQAQEYEANSGGGQPRRRSRHATPIWLPAIPVEEEEALLLIGIL